MTIRVAFVTPAPYGPFAVALITAGARAYEDVTVGSGTTGAAHAGEVAVVVNDESTTTLVAVGSDPDAGTTTATADSSAGVPIAAGASATIALKTGDKLDTAAAASS